MTPLPVGASGSAAPALGAVSSAVAAAPVLDETLTGTGPENWATRPRRNATAGQTQEALEIGTVLTNRYAILRRIGEGGMGAVYQARDLELNRVVALKVIRPSLAKNPEILSRFKQELILARQITHRNVIRIYDLSESDGLRFITMDFIDGRDLKNVLRTEGKFEPRQAAEIIEQVCRGLEAAHSESVIHRDLKPQNIMMDRSGKIIVMDFGIARSTAPGGMTHTGVLVGTPEYMSPEQAKGEKLDARSDLFSVGIIFYELLTGDIPYKADTSMASLYKRTREKVPPPIELAPKIPKALNAIVMRCLEIDKDKRYASATEILADLELWLGPRAGTRMLVDKKRPWAASAGWAAAATIVVLASGAFVVREKWTRAPAQHKEVSLLVADFQNRTGDSVFDQTLEPAFIIGLEGASFIQSFSRSTARQEAAQLKPGTTALDEPVTRMIATRDGIDVIVLGSIDKKKKEYAIELKAMDGITGNTISAKSRLAEKSEVLSAIGRLAADLRGSLGDTTPESIRLSAQETFTADSLDAAHEYAEAQNLLWDGKWEEALPHYEQATKLDPDMGRAYAGYAVASMNLGRRRDAEKYFQQALTHIDRMTEREKYRTRGSYFILRREPAKAIEEYSALLKAYPYDDAGHSNLAFSYFLSREMQKAVEEERRDVENNPRGLMQRTNLALYETYAGNFQNAVKEAQEVLKRNPKSVSALGALALGHLGDGKAAEATAVYEKMRPLSARGASSSATGLADVALWEGRLTDAREILDKGIAIDETAKNTDAAAIKLNYLAGLDLAEGDGKRGVAASEKALAFSRDPVILYGSGHIATEAGQTRKAISLASELASKPSSDSRSYADLLFGEVDLKNGDAANALNKFQEAKSLADSWLAHFDLGRAYLAMGAFSEASSEFDICMKRRGEAAAIFLDDVPSYHLYAPVLYYQGLAHEGLKSADAAQYFKQFLAIKAKGAGDPMIADARRHLGLN
jgi:tetratricopeptide (TPR) repeat protein/predicted Ser/Thr protein kinase